MAKSNLLQEAIADAKRVKSAALANAKIALEETFQPTLQRMISSKLAEEEEDELGLEDGDDFGGDFDDDGGFNGEIDIKVNPAGGGEGDAQTVGFGGSTEEDDLGDEGLEDDSRDPELESLIRELESEMEDDDQMMEGEEDQWSSNNPNSEKDQFAESDGYDQEEDDMVEAVLEALLGEEDGLGDELDLGKNKEDGSVFDETPPNGPQFLENRKLRSENKQLKKELQEALKSITTYKKAINDVNLLNAKMMYTTKTLNQYELTENQQVKILESFDRATSVREVKLVYTTIVESFNKKDKKTSIKETKGFASKSVKQVNPKTSANNQSKAIIGESTVSRLQQLAGLKKLED